jgi:hypothetical protein
MTEEGTQNITYRRRRYRIVEGRREEMEDTPGKNANASLTGDKEDCLIKGLMKALQDIAEGQRETREFMGRITGYALGVSMVKKRKREAIEGRWKKGKHTQTSY